MNVIDCRKVQKRYGGRRVLDDLTFTLTGEKITGLIGRNGVGKTTLLKILAGFIREDGGEVQVFSKRPFNSLFVSANSIMIDDHMTFPATLNLGELLAEGERFYEYFDLELATRLMNHFSIPLRSYHQNLSKGMKSTFQFIFALSSRCALTLLDEPTSGMDAAVRKDIYRALLKDYVVHPRSIIISSHHLEEVENLLEEILLIHKGKVLQHLPISDLKEWAIGLQGKKSAVNRWTDGQELIHESEAGPGLAHAVIRNTLSEAAIQQIRQDGIAVTPVAANDLCIYLTSDDKGGIDHVFDRTESI